MSNRYGERKKMENSSEMYKDVFEDRGVKRVIQYTTPTFKYPSMQEIAGLTVINHRWRRGDRFYKLADLYYNDPTKWWVIAQFNKTPTEFPINFGDLIMVPTPLELVMQYYRQYG